MSQINDEWAEIFDDYKKARYALWGPERPKHGAGMKKQGATICGRHITGPAQQSRKTILSLPASWR